MQLYFCKKRKKKIENAPLEAQAEARASVGTNGQQYSGAV